MGICWYCHWGWPKQVYDIYMKYLALLDGDDVLLEFQQAHIVWSDENFETECIESCIIHADEYWDKENVTKEEHDLITESLKELLLVPEEIRCCEPEEYIVKNRTGNNEADPKDYPPPAGIVMVKNHG